MKGVGVAVGTIPTMKEGGSNNSTCSEGRGGSNNNTCHKG
jgi:hypothetical protein